MNGDGIAGKRQTSGGRENAAAICWILSNTMNVVGTRNCKNRARRCAELRRYENGTKGPEIPEDPDRCVEPEEKEKAANGIRL